MSCCEEYGETLFDVEGELYETRDRVRELEATMNSMLELFESRGQHAAGDMVNMINRAMEGR